MLERSVSILCTCFIAFFISGILGCTRLGPDYQRPDIGVKIPASFENTTGASGFGKLHFGLRWEELFPALGLEKIISELRNRNLDIKIAAQRVIQARLQLKQVGADRLPKANLNMEAQRQEKPITGIFPGGSFSTKTDSFVLSGAASYELDLWGRLARSTEAALAQVLEAEENRRTLELTVEAEVVSRCVKMAIIKRRISIAQKRIANQDKTLTTVERRYKRGLASLMELKRAKSALAQARAAVPLLREEMARTGQELSFLLGQYPRRRLVGKIGPEYLDLLGEVPEGLPSKLLLRRPDVRAAEHRLRALSAKIGVARANRFPRITLTGTYGYTSGDLEVLIGPGSKLWSIAAGLVQPLFDAGKLKAVEEETVARYNQGVAEYAKTVLNAFLEVENALVTRKEQLERRKMVLEFLREARDAEELTQKRYKRGLTDYLNLLDSQRTRFGAEDSLALVDLAILTNRVALIRALGGGWN